MKKITAIVVACCFLNVVLYAPAFAIETYANKFEKNTELLINKFKNNEDLLNKFPAFKMFAQLTDEATANPESFDAKAFIQSFNDAGVSKNIEFEKMKPFLDKLESSKSADTQTLLKETQTIIGTCIALIATSSVTPSSTLMLSMLQNIDKKLEFLNNPSELNQLQADNQTINVPSDVYWLFVYTVELSAIISIYGAGTTTPVATCEIALLASMLIEVSNLIYAFTGLDLIVVNTVVLGIGAVSGITFFFSSIFGGQIDLLLVKWVMNFVAKQGAKILFPVS